MNSGTKGIFSKKLLAAIAVTIVIVAAILVVWQAPNLLQQPSTTPNASPSPTSTANSSANPPLNLPDMTLTVVGANGEQVVLQSADIAALTQYTAPGGFKSSGGYIAAVGTYTGVPVLTLCDLVGGMTSDQTLTVTASDGYSMVYTYNQVSGKDFTTYDAVTGSEAAATQPMKMVINYFINGTALPSDEGPLRIGVTGPEGLLTEGHFWTKMVSKIEVTNNIKDWVVTVDSTGDTEPLNMDRQAFTADVNHFPLNWTDSNGNIWTGTALWRWVSWYNYNGGISNETLDKGYSVKVIAGDGYSATLDDSRVKMNDNIIVAVYLNGGILSDPYWPLTLVGPDVTGQEKIKNIVQIQIVLDSSTTPSPTVTSTPTPSTSPSSTPPPTQTPSPTSTPAPTATPAPGQDYSIVINGTAAVTMSRSAFEAQVSSVTVSYTDSSGTTWTGTPLHRIVMWGTSNGAISSSALTDGYVVKVIASDGFSAAFNDTRIDGNTRIFVANQANGTALIGSSWPLSLSGGDITSGKERLKGIAQIQIIPIPHVNVTLVAANGTQFVLYSKDLATLASYTASGGTRSSSGKLSNYGTYTGVPMLTLCNMIGLTSSSAVKVTSSDGYTTTYTYTQLNAQGVTTYDSSGNPVIATQPLTLILAYLMNGTSIPSADGPLRTMIVGPEGLYSTGSLSAKLVAKIEILN
ncbi:MAG: hypothetical protein ACE14S_07705 [Candidatus Bathyarchaeia archaeon]